MVDTTNMFILILKEKIHLMHFTGSPDLSLSVEVRDVLIINTYLTSKIVSSTGGNCVKDALLP